jgi:hypothetical protein
MALHDIAIIVDENELIHSALTLFQGFLIDSVELSQILEALDVPMEDIQEYFNGMILDEEEWDKLNAQLYGQ